MYELLVVGGSQGGARALGKVLNDLPREFPLAVAIVLHRHRDSDALLLKSLQKQTVLPLQEAEDKTDIVPGRGYLAPADYHLMVNDGCFGLSTEAPVRYARPSIDLLFESAADACGKRVIGLVLSGANQDGARGLARIKEQGGLTLVQDPSTAEAAAMPAAAIAVAAVDRVLALADIASCLLKLTTATKRDRHG